MSDKDQNQLSTKDRKGYVYILTNQSFSDDWIKIGKSKRQVDIRSKELDNTAIPLPFDIYATIKTEKFNQVEKLVHKTIDRLTDMRIRKNREFFNVDPAVALDIFRDIAALIDDAEVYIYQDNIPHLDYGQTPDITKQNKSNRKAFKFSMAGIEIGEEITFIPTGQKVKVIDQRHIMYNDRVMTMTGFAKMYMPDDKRVPSDTYQGPKYFQYKGKILTELRDELEKDLEE